jgi:hypothetical protein
MLYCHHQNVDTLKILLQLVAVLSCRVPATSSPVMQLPVSYSAPATGEPKHTSAHHHHQPHHHQELTLGQRGAAPEPALLPHAGVAAENSTHGSKHAADTAAYSRGVDAAAGGAGHGPWDGRGGYSRGADAAAESLMRQWQALPGPLEMGGEMPLSR